ncbi:MAG: SPOR domain-containing protein [Bacteroidia bacterium]|nr:SPOR domain-containing protein [Bacteroidia bacterium]MDW8088874.1 SPOR domain-containing protein [Bacteroidia bacterium]
MSVRIDFQAYVSFLAAELPRFSLPGLGSFVWHVEKSQVDPKTGVVSPPRPFLKYEPGLRYQAETVAFLRDYFGIEESEAAELLREIGRLTAAYLKASPELDLWRIGKLKRVGGLYRLEPLEEGPVPPVTAELYEVSLRAGAVGVGPPLPQVEPSTTPKVAKKEKAKKTKAVLPPQPESPRAQVVEEEREIQPVGEVPPRRRGLVLILAGTVGLALLLVGAVWLLTKRPAPRGPVEIREKGIKEVRIEHLPSAAQPKRESVAPSKSPSSASVSPSPKSESASGAKPLPPPPPEPASPPPSPPKPAPAGARYYLIVGSYPSQAEAEANAARFRPTYKVEFLPSNKPGWVRLSIFSSSDPKEVQSRLKAIKKEVPDAWVYKSP